MNHLPSTTVMRHDGRVTGRRVGDRDGFGGFGIVDETPDGLLCHECGRRFIHLGPHVYKAHGVTADEYLSTSRWGPSRPSGRTVFQC